jgi:hypothetical protein
MATKIVANIDILSDLPGTSIEFQGHFLTNIPPPQGAYTRLLLSSRVIQQLGLA